MKSISILNIGAGKQKPINIHKNKYYLINLDKMYFKHDFIDDIEGNHREWDNLIFKKNQEKFCIMDAFKFLERYSLLFNKIVCYRFLEHISYTDLLYFIYLMSTSLKIGGIVEVIVPDYTILATRILYEDVNTKDFESENIITTTELLNEPSNPHCSIWTSDRIKYYFTFEKRFRIKRLITNYNFDGRNIYIYFQAERIK